MEQFLQTFNAYVVKQESFNAKQESFNAKQESFHTNMKSDMKTEVASWFEVVNDEQMKKISVLEDKISMLEAENARMKTENIQLEASKVATLEEIIKLKDEIHTMKVRKANSVYKGQDQEKHVLEVLENVVKSGLSAKLEDVHKQKKSGDAKFVLNCRDYDINLLIDSKNYGQSSVQKPHVVKAVEDAKSTQSDVIVLVYDTLPAKISNGIMRLSEEGEYGLMKFDGGFSPHNIYICTKDTLMLTITRILAEYNRNFHIDDFYSSETFATMFEAMTMAMGLANSEGMKRMFEKFTNSVLLLKRSAQFGEKTTEKKNIIEMINEHFEERSGKMRLSGTKRQFEEIFE